ncbi:MAG: ribonuclease III [Polyangiaceae bacterium]|nr:ribonuclease III [Polyangiaceae bacterium]
MIDPVAALFAALGQPEAPPAAMEALTHGSWVNERGARGARDYQRLEFLGDAVLGVCVTERLLRLFPDAPEGELSRVRSLLVCAESLAAAARRVELGAALRLGRGAAADRDNMNILADALEASLAAVYLHAGLEGAHRAVARLFDDDALAAARRFGVDVKSALQELAQREGRGTPSYELLGATGPENERVFEIEVSLGGAPLARGRGRSKKLAEQAAARAALEHLEPDP